MTPATCTLPRVIRPEVAARAGTAMRGSNSPGISALGLVTYELAALGRLCRTGSIVMWCAFVEEADGHRLLLQLSHDVLLVGRAPGAFLVARVRVHREEVGGRSTSQTVAEYIRTARPFDKR